MKIVVVNHEFPPVGGGAATACELLVKSLSAQGHQVEVITSRVSCLPAEELRETYCVKRALGYRTSVFSGTLAEIVLFLAHGFIYFLFKGKQIRGKVVYAFFSLPAGLLALWSKIIYNTPYVVFLRGIDVPGFYGGRFSFLNKMLRPLIKCIWLNADKVIANSEALKNLAAPVISRKAISVLPNLIDIDFFHPLEKRRHITLLKFIFAGRLNKQKGIDYLLDSFSMLSRNERVLPFILEIIGDGPERGALVNRCIALGIEAEVIFLGWLTRESLLEQYQNSDIFVSLSLDEGMPNAMMEAMACGLPVIASNIAAHRNLIEHGSNGLLVPPGNPTAVARAMSVLMRDRPLRQKMGGNNVAKIGQYSIQNRADSFQALGVR
jgi:glycosyltransferase involved in cell wall biosynthesis